MFSDKRFYFVFFCIITLTGFMVVVQSGNWINFFIVIIGLSFCFALLIGVYIIFTLFSVNGKSLMELIGW